MAKKVERALGTGVPKGADLEHPERGAATYGTPADPVPAADVNVETPDQKDPDSDKKED